MKKTIKLLLIPMILSLYLSTPLVKGVFAFLDVSEGNEYYMAIKYLEKNGIIDGYNDGTFKPDHKTNRAEALKMITLASGIITKDEVAEINENEDKMKRPFTDTPTAAWYTAYLKTAKKKGLINGYDDGSFKPEQTINLAEALKIILESFKHTDYPEISNHLYIDTPENEWFAKYTAYAGSKGIINIYNSNNVNPEQEMTRGYLAEIIYRYLMAKEQGNEFGKATFYGSAVQGYGTASGEIFDMNELTAAHKTLPFGTIVEVTNLANGKSVEVKINDRGPYGPGRVIDLSSAAFEQIAWLGTGVINVQIKIISTP